MSANHNLQGLVVKFRNRAGDTRPALTHLQKALDDQQLLRYSRHLLLPELDAEGQAKLLAARVLIVGVGGLGSPAAIYLAAAGVGSLLLSDPDNVELSNLQRQIVHSTDQLGKLKVNSAAGALHRINPDVSVTPIAARLTGEALIERVQQVDVVLDCSDNFATRFAVNAACVEAKVPLVSGAVIRFEGQLCVFDSRLEVSPCYNCLYPAQGELADTCARSGIIAPLPGIVGSWQALEALKLLACIGDPPIGRLLLIDALRAEWQTLRFRRDPSCPTCGPEARNTQAM